MLKKFWNKYVQLLNFLIEKDHKLVHFGCVKLTIFRMDFFRIDHCVVPAAALQAGGGGGGGGGGAPHHLHDFWVGPFGWLVLSLCCSWILFVLEEKEGKLKVLSKMWAKSTPHSPEGSPLCPSLHRRILSRERLEGRGGGGAEGLVEAGLSNQ